jgi:hypothetical protein
LSAPLSLCQIFQCCCHGNAVIRGHYITTPYRLSCRA